MPDSLPPTGPSQATPGRLMFGAGWAGLVLVGGLILTIWVARLIQSELDEKARTQFNHSCAMTQGMIAERFSDHEQILRSGAAFFADTDGVTRDEWHAFAERQKVSQTLPGIQGIGFAKLVPAAQLGKHVQAVRAEGFSDYQVRPEGQRDTYSAIVFLEPFAGRNLRAFGYDMLTEAVRREAMERARDLDVVALSGKVLLVQETAQDIQAGTLMYAPVYRMGSPLATVAERRAALSGWVYSPYRMNDLMQGILGHENPTGQQQLQIQIFDGEQVTPAGLLYGPPLAANGTFPPKGYFARQVPVTFNGRCWNLRFSQPGDGLFTARFLPVWIALASGLFMTALLFSLIRVLLNTRAQAQRIAADLTVNLRQSAESLRHISHRLELATQVAGVGIWDYNVVDNKLDWDDQMFRLYGIKQDQFGGAYEAWQAGLHPDDRERGDRETQLALQNEKEFNTEFRVLWPDGTTHHIRGFATVERDEFGQALRMVGTNWDITGQKRAEQELARLGTIQQAMLHLATEFVNVPLEQQDAAINKSLATMGRALEARRVFLGRYDFAAGVMTYTHMWSEEGELLELANLQPLPIAPIQQWVDFHLRGEPVIIPNLAALPADSPLRQMLEPHKVHSVVTLPLMQGDACLGFVGVNGEPDKQIWQQGELSLLRVLAELYSNFEVRRTMEHQARELQGGLTTARDAAQAAAQAKSLFLANMSHEIRTPLNAVLGYAQIMERECQKCPSKARLKPITRGGHHLLELLTDLLELVRSDAHKLTLAPRDFDFHQKLDDVRLIFVGQAEAQGLALELSRAADVPQFLHADAGKVRQILVNLLGNALKFTSRGCVRVVTSVLAGTMPGEARIAVEVEDTGSGMTPAELERIFDIFEQAEHGRKSGKGAGLGLPLSRRYAQALGGDITVSSQPGQGSRFCFTFRARVVSDAQAIPSHQPCVRHLAAEQPACHLLVVDDEPENRDMLRALLEPVGFSVETAASAGIALQRLGHQDHGIALVLMDLRMPEMDGYEAIRRLRALPHGRDLPVLVVTASGFEEEHQRALAAGANGCVAKPVRREWLLAEISSIIGTRYEYEAAEPVHAAPATLDAAALTGLTAEQLRLLSQALLHGDVQQLRGLIAEIAVEQHRLADSLLVLVNAYEYDRLHRLLDAAKNRGAGGCPP